MADGTNDNVTSDETTWVRSMYLYVMCAAAVALVVIGGITSVAALANVISPSLGHRDSLDRVGIGLANVATDIVDSVMGVTDSDADILEEYCDDISGGDDDAFDECMDLNASAANPVGAVTDGIGDIKSELESQIRSAAIARLIRGLLFVIAGWLLWKFHANRTRLYGDGGLRGSTASTAPSAPAVATAPVPTVGPPTMSPQQPEQDPQ